jgi:endothelin-converting enzyme/putative endopeptidase
MPTLSRSILIALITTPLACTRPPAELPQPAKAVAPPPIAAPEPVAAQAAPGGWQLDRSTFDPAADPCTDFYQHVCGGFATVDHIPPDRAEAYWAHDAAGDANDRAIQQLLTGNDAPDDPELGRLRTFFASCMAHDADAEHAREDTLARWLARIDGITTRRGLMAVVRELHDHGVDALFHYGGEPDRTNQKRYRGELHQGSFGTGGRRNLAMFADKTPAGKDRLATYRAHVQTMLELSGIPAARAGADARSVVDLEAALAAVALPFGAQWDPAVSEHPMTPKALAALAPHVEWPAYFAMVGHPADQPVNVTSPTYLKVVDGMLATRPLAALRSYLRWQFLASLAPALPARLADERARFSTLAGVARGALASTCQLETLKAMGVELSREFSTRFIGTQARDRARAAAERIQAEIVGSVKAMTWLSPVARAATEEHIRMLALKSGFPDRWPATGSFPLRGDAFLDNVLTARAFEQQRVWARARAERRRDSWEGIVYPNAAAGMAAARLTIVNAFPDVLSNSIIFTAAYLRRPLFRDDAPPEVQYGGFGALAGHEFVHVLENHEFDGIGEMHDVWTPADVQAHDARKACLVEQASQFALSDTVHLDGTKTYDENVADLSGVAHAYAAMVLELGPRVTERGPDGLSPAQRFFIADAQHWCHAERPAAAEANLRDDGHAPVRFRVNNPLSNLPAFAEAFSCRSGAAMARPAANRCTVW